MNRKGIVYELYINGILYVNCIAIIYELYMNRI